MLRQNFFKESISYFCVKYNTKYVISFSAFSFGRANTRLLALSSARIAVDYVPKGATQRADGRWSVGGADWVAVGGATY